MKTHFLLPRYFMYIGMILAGFSIMMPELPSDSPLKFEINLTIPVIYDEGKWFTLIENNMDQEIIIISRLIGFYFIAFAKEKIEDEMINNIRLRSMMIAIISQIGLQIAMELFLYNGTYWQYFGLSFFSLLPIYIIVFQAYKLKIKLSHEE